jgi:hypothetical protein
MTNLMASFYATQELKGREVDRQKWMRQPVFLAHRNQTND